MPSLTVIALLGGIRSVDSGVLKVRGTVPVPVAREPADDEEPDEFEELDEAEELEDVEDDDPVELAEEFEPADWVCCSALWIAAVSAVLVRANASWLAMLDRPLDKLVVAEPIDEISASVLASDWERDCAWLQ